MRKISVEELKPGMRFDKPVYIDANNMLVAANVAIKEDDIKKLMKWGVVQVETGGEVVSTESDIKVAQRIARTTSDDARKIIADYNNLLKKRKILIEVHRQASVAVENAHAAIRANKLFTLDEIDEALDSIIKLMSENNNIFLFLYGLEEGQNYLVAHSVNVTFYSLLIGMSMKYAPNRLRELGRGTLLIDAGMVKMPLYIIHKQSNLSDHEYNLIKTHPLHGYKVVKQLANVNERVALVALQHHEQFDGKGYPRGLTGNQIDEYARIAAIADSYEAQISNRAYRKKQYFYHAMRNLLSSGINRFDPVLLRVFLSRMSVYPIGSLVELNDGCVGLVVGSIPQKPLRPFIKLIFDNQGKRLEETTILNLLEESALYIVKALDESEAGINILDVL
ncbi:MAG TPA: HD-GYP domain-containing protein [Spirochaetota bacterium]|nr:HD-GYP domain-containing protein [Spirochaetota bacterium]HNT10228.1 HD-GYP domain-containing protein [Spirochaetota bacterium]HNV46245.1 HD-GYP domain-containing protein [Spirochaetota bacterium]HOS41818.1 HD-GYP domain-containing protein [Spirochaetota bacterium]HPI22901.1 HD-GYP domain-containing protein [Spirochaetota bacterium]